MTSVLARALQGRFETAALNDYLDLVIKLTQVNTTSLAFQNIHHAMAACLPPSTLS